MSATKALAATLVALSAAILYKQIYANRCSAHNRTAGIAATLLAILCLLAGLALLFTDGLTP